MSYWPHRRGAGLASQGAADLKRKDGTVGRKAVATLRDETGEVEVTFWDDLADTIQIAEGECIQVNLAAVKKSSEYGVQVSSGRGTKVVRLAAGSVVPGREVAKLTVTTRAEITGAHFTGLGALADAAAGESRVFTKQFFDVRRMFVSQVPDAASVGTYAACGACWKKWGLCDCGGTEVKRFLGTMHLRDATGAASVKVFHDTFVVLLGCLKSEGDTPAETADAYVQNGAGIDQHAASCVPLKGTIELRGGKEGRENELVLREVSVDLENLRTGAPRSPFAFSLGWPPVRGDAFVVDVAGNLSVKGGKDVQIEVAGLQLMLRVQSTRVVTQNEAGARLEVTCQCALTRAPIIVIVVGSILTLGPLLGVRKGELCEMFVTRVVVGVGADPKMHKALLANGCVVARDEDQMRIKRHKAAVEAYQAWTGAAEVVGWSDEMTPLRKVGALVDGTPMSERLASSVVKPPANQEKASPGKGTLRHAKPERNASPASKRGKLFDSE